MEGKVSNTTSVVSDVKKNDLFFNKIISRTSSVGCSSRANYYYRSQEGVPFEWEMQPGTPKEPPRPETPLPPLSPPPAVINLALPKPCMENSHQYSSKEFPFRLMRLDGWKKVIKKYRLQKAKKEVRRLHDNKDLRSIADTTGRVSDVDNFEDSFEFWGSDPRDEFMVSPSRSSNSSSASTMSFSNGPAAESNYINTSHDQPRSCIPLKLSSIFVYVAKRG